MRHFEKITRVYSERREQQIAVRIHYDISADGWSKVIGLKQVQDFLCSVRTRAVLER